jgi:hypothetical protein
MAGKTYPELTLATDVQDADLLAAYRSPGPVKKLTASVFGDYVSKTLTAFIASGTGAVARTLQARNRDFVNDADFDTLENAATAALAQGKPLGITTTHTRSTTWTVPAGLEVLGRGGSITTTNNVANAVQAGGDGVKIRGLRLIGPGSGTTPGSITTANGVAIIAADLCEVTDCVITGFGWCGVLIRNSSGFRVSGNLFYGNVYYQEGGADICTYSTVDGHHGIISDNRCFSNNDIGIFYNATGGDQNVSIIGNHCVPTTNGVDRPADVDNKRRHGIALGYTDGVFQITCVGNVVRGCDRTGIYVATTSGFSDGTIIANNVIEDCGFYSGAEQSLCGGIFVNAGSKGLVIANNAVTNFRNPGLIQAGGIVISSIAGSTGSVIGNTIKDSQASGIVLKSVCGKWLVQGNQILGSVKHDIFEENNATAESGGHDIVDNYVVRTNASVGAIRIGLESSTEVSRVSRNRIIGFDNTVSGCKGVEITNGVNVTKRLIVTDNWIENFFDCVSVTNSISGRVFNRFIIDRNYFKNCTGGFVVTGVNAVCIGQDNICIDCTNPARGTAAYVAWRENLNIVLPSSAAFPAAGTWIVGDRAIGPGVIGQPKAWTCTTAGVAGAAVWTSEGNL